MANYQIKFLGTERSETEQYTIEAFSNNFNEIFISIEGYDVSHICLDKSTAIKFAKLLRTEINNLEDSL